MKKNMIAALFAVGGIAVAGGSQAAVITDSFTNAFQTTEISQSGTLSLFDSSLGTLNSVTLTLTGNSESTTSLENTAAQAQTFSFQSDLNYFFTLSNGVSVAAPAFTTILATTGFTTLAAGATLDIGTRNDFGSVTVTGPLASFTGIGNFTVNCSTISGSTFSGGGGNIDTNQVTTANCIGDIAYDFTPTPTTGVPEPTALWLLGVGLLGLVGARKQFC